MNFRDHSTLDRCNGICIRLGYVMDDDWSGSSPKETALSVSQYIRANPKRSGGREKDLKRVTIQHPRPGRPATLLLSHTYLYCSV